MQTQISGEDKEILLRIARSAIETRLRGLPLRRLKLSNFSETLRAPGASFVTLTRLGSLRGCIGVLEAYQPLVLDVREHAVAAALEDYRFPPVKLEELDQIRIEISRLTEAQPLLYQTPQELLEKLRPFIDGVILEDGRLRATFLPQVWEKLPEKEVFLARLCQKMGASPNLWREKVLKVRIYQVEEFAEADIL